MATSTITDPIVLNGEAVEKLAKLFDEPIPPWPELPEENFKRGEELSEQFRINLEKRLNVRKSK